MAKRKKNRAGAMQETSPLPIVTENSQISRLAQRTFLAAVPPAWTASEPHEGDDYGIDVSLQVTDGAHPSGRFVHVQLKGTRATGADASLIRIRASTLNYLRSLADAAVILRTQVDEQRSWLVHVHDPRAFAPPDDEGWVRISCAEKDSVTTETLRRRLATLSYRKRWQTSPASDFKVLVSGAASALALQSKLQEGLPTSLTFVSGADDQDASVQAECVVTEKGFTMRDFALPLERMCEPVGSAEEALISLAAFFAQGGAWALATSIMAMSADRFDDATIERCLSRADEYHLMGVFIDHGSEDDIATLGERGTAARRAWAARWLVSFVISGRLQNVSLPTIDAAFAAWPGFDERPGLRLRKAQILARFHYLDQCREVLRSIDVEALDDPVELFEFGAIAERAGLRDGARSAWRAAQHAGYDTVACQLEIALSLLADGQVAEAVRRTPPKCTPKDARMAALFHSLTLIKQVFGAELKSETSVLQAMLSDLDKTGMVLVGALRPETPGTDATKQLLAMVLSLMIALRDEDDVDAWTCSLTCALLLRAPAPLVDAIVVLASARHGGEPLRRAAAAFPEDRRGAVLEKWHRRVDENRGRNLVRRREDFVRERGTRQKKRVTRRG